MVKQGMKSTFPPELIKEAITYNLGQRFKVAANICRADISGDQGWVALELEGRVDYNERGIAWVTGKGVGVDPVTGDIVEG